MQGPATTNRQSSRSLRLALPRPALCRMANNRGFICLSQVIPYCSDRDKDIGKLIAPGWYLAWGRVRFHNASPAFVPLSSPREALRLYNLNLTTAGYEGFKVIAKTYPATASRMLAFRLNNGRSWRQWVWYVSISSGLRASHSGNAPSRLSMVALR